MVKKLTVLYDACVFYPNYLRDVLMQLTTTNLFQARWTDQIHDEWIRNLLANRPDLSAERLNRLRGAINRSVSDGLVADFEHLIPSLDLPDPDDRHVLAAGIVAKVDVIVTFNLKDFPASALGDYGIKSQHPDDFITDLIDVGPLKVFEAVRTIQTRLKNPRMDFEKYMDVLLNQGLPISVSKLRQMQSGFL